MKSTYVPSARSAAHSKAHGHTQAQAQAQAQAQGVDIIFPHQASAYPEPSYQALDNFLNRHLDSHQTEANQDWPVGAEYCARYRVQAWPCGASHHTAYFNDCYELSKWFKSQVAWARLEDNYFSLDALYMWDLGPQLLDDSAPHIGAV